MAEKTGSSVTLMLCSALLAAQISIDVNAADKHAIPTENFSTGGEWGSYNKSFDGQRYSPLRQINAGNVAALAEVCRFKVEDHGSFQAGLI